MTNRRALLATAGTGLAAATAGCLGVLGGGSSGSGSADADVTPASGPVTTAPLPDEASTYARMGTDGPTVTYYGNWKCPFCAEFAVGSDRVVSLSTVVEEYLTSGNLSLEYRSVAYLDGDPFLGADAPLAARAGLSVWNRDREAYWTYHETVMATQPPEGEQWATADRLAGFAEAAGVRDAAGLREDLQSGAYEDEVRVNTDPFLAAFGDQRAGTPAVVVDGTPYSPFQPEQFRGALDSLVG
jgi:protein-disulfide isomerase